MLLVKAIFTLIWLILFVPFFIISLILYFGELKIKKFPYMHIIRYSVYALATIFFAAIFRNGWLLVFFPVVFYLDMNYRKEIDKKAAFVSEKKLTELGEQFFAGDIDEKKVQEFIDDKAESFSFKNLVIIVDSKDSINNTTTFKMFIPVAIFKLILILPSGLVSKLIKVESKYGRKSEEGIGYSTGKMTLRDFQDIFYAYKSLEENERLFNIRVNAKTRKEKTKVFVGFQ